MALAINKADALEAKLNYLFAVDTDNAIKELVTGLPLTTTGVSVNGTTAPFGRSFRPNATTLVGPISGVNFPAFPVPNNADVSVFVVANQFVSAPSNPGISVPLFGPDGASKKVGSGIQYDPASGKFTHHNQQGGVGLSSLQLTAGTINTGAKTFGFSRTGAANAVVKCYIGGALDANFTGGVTSSSLFGANWSDSEMGFIGGWEGFGWASFDYVYIAVFVGDILTDADFTRLHASATGSNAFALVTGSGGGSPTLPGGVTITNVGNASFTADWQTPSGGTGPYTYDYSTNGGTTYTSWPTNTRNLSGLTPAGSLIQFRVRAVDSLGALSNELSAAVQLTGGADAPPAFTLSPQSGSYTAGQAATLTWAATGTPTPTLTLQRSTNGGVSFVDVAASGGTYTTPALVVGDSGVQYRVRAENTIASTPQTVYSSVAALTVAASGGGTPPPAPAPSTATPISWGIGMPTGTLILLPG